MKEQTKKELLSVALCLLVALLIVALAGSASYAVTAHEGIYWFGSLGAAIAGFYFGRKVFLMWNVKPKKK